MKLRHGRTAAGTCARVAAILAPMLMVCLCGHSGDAGSLSLAGVLAEARQARQSLPPLAMHVQALDFLGRDRDSVSEAPRQKCEYDIRIQGDRYEAFCTTYVADANGTLKPNMVFRKYWDGSRTWGWTGSAKSTEKISIVKETEESYHRLLFDQNAGHFLDGRFLHYFGGDWIDIIESAPDAALADAFENVGDRECLAIAASTAHGDYELWVDPACGYALRQARIIVESDDLAWGATLTESPNRPAGPHMTRIEMSIEDVGIEAIDGHYIPTRGTLVTVYRYDTGDSSATVKKVSRSDIRLNPDFDAMDAFKIDYPEGATVQRWFEGDARLHYVWQEGRLAPKMDEAVIEAINRDLDVLSALAQEAGTAPGPE